MPSPIAPDSSRRLSSTADVLTDPLVRTCRRARDWQDGFVSDVPQWLERFVLLYFSGPDGRSRVPEVFPPHHAYTLSFTAERPGELLLTGPFADPIEGQPGAMNIFTSREAAETFAAADPFVTEGVVDSWTVRTWLTGAN